MGMFTMKTSEVSGELPGARKAMLSSFNQQGCRALRSLNCELTLVLRSLR